MELKSIKYLCALAEFNSISEAANHVGITQPTMSKFLMQYEQKSAFHIFNKLGKKVFLTEEGRIYIKKCEEILQLSKQLDDLKFQFSNNDAFISIGITPIRGGYILPNILPEFSAKCPYCEIKIKEGNVHEIESFIREGQVDIGIFLLDDKEYPDFIIEELNEEEILLCAKQGSICDEIATWKKEFHYPWVDLSLLRKEFFILPSKTMRMHPRVHDFFAQYNYYPNHIRSSNVDGNMNLASQGYGYSFVPEISSRFCRTINKTHCFSVGKTRKVMPFGIAYHKNAYLSPSCKEMIEIVKKVFGGHTSL